MVLVCSACNVVFPLPDQQPVTPDGAVGADVVVPDTSPPCSDDLVDEDFDAVGGPACGNATPEGEGLSRLAGRLVVQPAGGRAGCITSGIAFTLASVEVVAVPSTPLTFAELALIGDQRIAMVAYRDGSGDATLVVEIDGAMSNPIAYDEIQHRFWQLRATDNRVVAETSDDGLEYDLAFDTGMPPPTSIKISIGGGVQSGQTVPSPGPSMFDNLAACPR